MNTDAAFESLDKQTRQVVNKISQKQEKIPAIDRFFMENRDCLIYLSPPVSTFLADQVEKAVVDEYVEKLKIIETDLKWLLALPYQKFWCQMIYDSSCIMLIDSYLKLAPRPHDFLKLKNLSSELLDLHNSIHRLVFFVCLRMSTFKESKEHFMTKEVFADLIYNNYLFDIPKIFDLCVLYKKNQVLPKIIENLFSSQKNYFSDFRLCLKDFIRGFEIGRKKLGELFELDAIYKTNESYFKKQTLLKDRIKSNLKKIMEMIYYLTDFAITINDLLLFQPQLAEILAEAKVENIFVDFIENTAFPIEDLLTQMKNEEDSEFDENKVLINLKLKKLKKQLAKLFKQILEECSVKYIMKELETVNQAREQLQQFFDTFVKFCCEVLGEKRFLCFYEEKYCFSEQIELIVQIAGDRIDNSQYKFIMENLKQSVLSFSKKSSVKARFSESSTKSNSISKPKNTEFSTNNTNKPSQPVDTQVDSLVQSVIDLLPGTDVILIKKCLKYFNKDVEQVINAFLENNLPEFPKESEIIDSEMPTTSNQASAFQDVNYDYDVEEYTDLRFKEEFVELSSRKNVYDNDEFDIFKKDAIDTSKIVFGKKKKTEDFNIDDKSGIDREFYKNYDILMYERQLSENAREYEDEYDDTYDSNMNAVEKDDMEEFIKPLNQKLDIKKRDMFDDDLDMYEEDEVDEEATTTPKNFTPGTKIEAKDKNFQNFQGQKKQNYPQRNQPENRSGNQKPYKNAKSDADFTSKSNQQYNRNQNPQSQEKNRDQNPKYNRNQNMNNQEPNREQMYQENLREGERFDSRSSYAQPQPQRQNPQPQPQSQQQHQNPHLQRQNPQPQRQPANKSGGFQLHQEALPQRNRNEANQRFQDEAREPREENEQHGVQREQKSEEQIKRERRLKNENKAKTVHHNRKDLAAKKSNFY